ncbi:MAG: PIN domain-containing protein [Candidatus Korarchaeum sp.]
MRARRAVIDTNVIIFAHFEDSKYHKEARKILHSLEEWILPFIVIVELFWFSRGANLNEKSRRSLLLSVLSDPRVRISHNEPEELMESVLAEDPLEFEDELILQQAEREGVPLATFDRSLAERARVRGIEVISISELS